MERPGWTRFKMQAKRFQGVDKEMWISRPLSCEANGEEGDYAMSASKTVVGPLETQTFLLQTLSLDPKSHHLGRNTLIVLRHLKSVECDYNSLDTAKWAKQSIFYLIVTALNAPYSHERRP